MRVLEQSFAPTHTQWWSNDTLRAPSSPTASFNVLQSSGSRIEFAAAAVVVDVEGEADKDDLVSPVDDACTTTTSNNNNKQQTTTKASTKTKQNQNVDMRDKGKPPPPPTTPTTINVLTPQ